MPQLNRTVATVLSATLFYSSTGIAQTQPKDITTSAPVTQSGKVQVATLTAETTAALAIKVAPSVRFAKASKAQADDAVDINAAMFAPELDLTASYTRLSPVTYPPLNFGGQTFDNPFPVILNNYLLQATLTIPVTDYFLKILPTYNAVDHNADVAKYQAQTEVQRIALQARESFYDYVRALAAAKVAQESVQQLESYVKDLHALYEVGSVTKADSMQAQAQLSDSISQLAIAEANVTVARDRLRRLLYLKSDAQIEVNEDIFAYSANTPANPQTMLGQALRNRPELKALRSLAKVRDASMQAEQARRLPNLAVVGNLDYANPNTRYTPLTEEFRATWNVGAVLRWSPNDFVLGKVNVEQAELEIQRARIDLEKLENEITIEASKTCSDYIAAQRTIEATKDAVRASEEAWRVRRDLLEAGEATSNEVLEAQIAWRRSQLLHINAYAALKVIRARLQYLIGKAAPEKSDHSS